MTDPVLQNKSNPGAEPELTSAQKAAAQRAASEASSKKKSAKKSAKKAASKSKPTTTRSSKKKKAQKPLASELGVAHGAGERETAPQLMNAEHPLAREQQLSSEGSPGTAAKTAVAMDSSEEQKAAPKTFRTLKAGTRLRMPTPGTAADPFLTLVEDAKVTYPGVEKDEVFVGLMAGDQENWNANAAELEGFSHVTGKREE